MSSFKNVECVLCFIIEMSHTGYRMYRVVEEGMEMNMVQVKYENMIKNKHELENIVSARPCLV